MADAEQWHKTACILCSINCGLEVQTGGEDGRRIVKIRGDAEHPASRGYVCEKSQRMDYYQNGADRLRSPMRRRADGSYEAISWEVAIREIAAKFGAIKTQYGKEAVLFYGGGGQGNHVGGMYADSFLKALGNPYRSNALAQEKTGEFWVQGKMLGTGVHPDFEHCEVALFVGKNPWQSHGFARARVLLKEIAKDPARCLIVIDPRRSETAEMADIHLAIKPGTDAWCLAALMAVLVQEDLVARDWLAEHTRGYEAVAPYFSGIDIASYAQACGLAEQQIRDTARRIAGARSVAMMEDLGLQMNRHSTLGSYLQRLIWLSTGHYARPGTNNAPVPFLSLAKASKGETSARRGPRVERRSPVANAKIIIGLVPCNVIPEEILSDHPKRYRAMLIHSGNPVHSLADSQRMREALRALELSVVVDVAMTETAREADYVLPAASQFEKAEATFFNLEFPDNVFHLRQPLFEPLPGTLPEAEIYARLVEAMGELGEADYAPLRRALRFGRLAFALRFMIGTLRNPKLVKYAPVILYRTLGERLPQGMASAAALWGAALLYVQASPATARAAGFGGLLPLAADRLFQAIISQPSGVVYARATHAMSWQAVGHPEHRINLKLDELLAELPKLDAMPPPVDADYPFVLSAGERRSETANTAVRDSSWHKRGVYGSLRINPQDARRLGCADGERLLLRTRRGSAEVIAELSDSLQPGHVSLPNGLGLDYRDASGALLRKGVAPNELTDAQARDPFAGTPWHKHVPARLERVAQALSA
ncbi:Anaerobic selenocysteine-containing dehydrogenase [Solimonas aquatica]|uniref:Anaerobic selenocysteine-containing dehydrogenase n=1 Tax=Solimonas aquatica TaxID=489703 RepID=A0A1H9GEK3_9GAMM|nr:molybdopterin-dependent oxidoreductase [Solimonas aquatica]SEQ48497.1 Anaerobic selenocysteine-containing dehydrogenase [Solimonas aquatica]